MSPDQAADSNSNLSRFTELFNSTRNFKRASYQVRCLRQKSRQRMNHYLSCRFCGRQTQTWQQAHLHSQVYRVGMYSYQYRAICGLGTEIGNFLWYNTWFEKLISHGIVSKACDCERCQASGQLKRRSYSQPAVKIIFSDQYFNNIFWQYLLWHSDPTWWCWWSWNHNAMQTASVNR